MKEVIIGKNEIDKRLDGFLKSYLPNASMGFIYKMLRKKNITLNGKKASGTEKLHLDDKIAIFFSDETLDKFKGKPAHSGSKVRKYSAFEKLGQLEVIYEDSDIVLINKPAGVLSQKSEYKDISLNDWLIEYLLQKGDITEEELETYKPSICNRLDRNTSGIVICAKSLSGARVMNQMLKDRTLDKYYRTIISGKMIKPYTLSGYLYKDEKKNKVFIKESNPHDVRYSYIETEFNPLKYSDKDNLSLIEVKLITGKTHQIRAHLSSQNTPIIGDVKYGGKMIDGLNYQLLHSYRICFPDNMPEGFDNLSGKEFIAEVPEIFKKYFG